VCAGFFSTAERIALSLSLSIEHHFTTDSAPPLQRREKGENEPRQGDEDEELQRNKKEVQWRFFRCRRWSLVWRCPG
jgi:hypothetical protein